MSSLRSMSCVGSGGYLIFGEFLRRMIDDLWAGCAETVWQLVRGDDTQVMGQFYHDVLGI